MPAIGLLVELKLLSEMSNREGKQALADFPFANSCGLILLIANVTCRYGILTITVMWLDWLSAAILWRNGRVRFIFFGWHPIVKNAWGIL